jgi:predicted Zn-dependent protease
VVSSDFNLGLRITLQAYHEVGMVEDDSLTNWVRDVGYRVASVAPQPALFTFHVIDLPYPNAFALPGGFVFVTRGMIEMGLGEAELAALLGHEIGHVIGRHFERSQRLASILSIAQIALLVGAIFVADDVGSSPARYEREGDLVYRGSTGGDALMQGVPAFGGLFRTLVERKYGRGLEYEADEWGAKLATQAGYPSSSAAGMLRLFRTRIHEETTYGYWLTHPFFSDRVPRAEAFARSLPAPARTPADYAFRRSIQQDLIRIAQHRSDETEAAFVYHLALGADPHGRSALEAGQEILRFRAQRDRKKQALLREIHPIQADYDSLITIATRIMPESPLHRSLIAERDSLDDARAEILPEYLQKIDGDLRATSLLERFVRNYPDHPRYAEVLHLLAENYRRSARPDQAAKRYVELLNDHGESPRAALAAEGLAVVIPRMESPLVLQELLEGPLPDSLHSVADARMAEVMIEVESLEAAAEFLERFPESPHAEAMRTQLEARATEMFREARILEGVAQKQQALDTYHRILFLAPDSAIAAEVRVRIDDLVRAG